MTESDGEAFNHAHFRKFCQFVHAGSAGQMHDVVKANGKAAIVPEPAIRAAALVGMRPGVVNYLSIAWRTAVLDEPRLLPSDFQITVSNCPELFPVLNNDHLREEVERASAQS
jgi:hypothetical protein